MSKQTKNITLNGLGATVSNLSAKVDKLASAMEAGFKQVNERMDTGFKRVDAKMDAGFKKAEENRESLARMISNGFEHTATKAGFDILENSQEEIKLRLDNVANKFEVRELERRVKRLEDKTGIRHTIQH